MSEEEHAEKLESENKKTPCPIYPSSVVKIMETVEKLDKGEIDEFGALEQVTGVLKEVRQRKLEALSKLSGTAKKEEEKEEAAES